MFGHQLYELLMLQMTGGGNDHVAGSKTLLVEIQHRITLELLDCIFRPQDGLAQRMVFPEILGEDFVDEVVGIILIHFYFFEDDAALARDIAAIEDGMKDEIAEDIHGERKVLIEDFDIEADTFLRRESIHIAADRIDLAGDGLGGAGLGTLEHHVLDEVGDAIPFRIFVARTGLQPDANRDGTNVGHLLGDDG